MDHLRGKHAAGGACRAHVRTEANSADKVALDTENTFAYIDVVRTTNNTCDIQFLGPNRRHLLDEVVAYSHRPASSSRAALVTENSIRMCSGFRNRHQGNNIRIRQPLEEFTMLSKLNINMRNLNRRIQKVRILKHQLQAAGGAGAGVRQLGLRT